MNGCGVRRTACGGNGMWTGSSRGVVGSVAVVGVLLAVLLFGFVLAWAVCAVFCAFGVFRVFIWWMLRLYATSL